MNIKELLTNHVAVAGLCFCFILSPLFCAGSWAATTDKASFVSETIPDNTKVTGGSSFNKTWTIKNSGTSTWTSSYKLSYASNQGGRLSSISEVKISGTVSPGKTYTFSLPMKAPAAQTSEKAYREDWKFTNPSGSTIAVGNSSTIWTSIKVPAVAPPATTDKASFVSETVPDNTKMTGGSSFNKTWTIKNSGTSTWTSSYKLSYASNQGGRLSSISEVKISGTVSPGKTYTFNLPMKAPAAQTSEKAYREDWKFTNPSGSTIAVDSAFSLWALINVPAAASPPPTIPTNDKQKPAVSKFSVDKEKISQGSSVTIYYTVTDSGGSGLKQVELWRSPNNKDWAEIGNKRRVGLSGNGPISGSFTDTPPSAGPYYYGAHVVDNAGNWADENGPKKVTVDVSSPQPPPTVPPPPTISTSDKQKPAVSKFSVDKEKISQGSSVTIYYTVTDSGGSGLKQVELWRSPNNKDWAEIGNKRRVGLSGNGPISGSFTDTPPSAGPYYYGAHVVDNAGNWDSENGPKKVTVDVSSPQPPPTVPPPPTITGGIFPLPVKFRKDKYDGLCAYKTSAGWHTGVDIPTPNDHPMVYAVCKGVIVIDNTRTNKYENYTVYPECKGKTQYCNYWNAFIVIAHDCNEDGKIDSYAYYGHLIRSTNSNNVSKGDPIGYIRDSFTEKDIANPSNNHLHFGYNKSIKQNHWGYYGNSCEEVYAAGWNNPIGYYFK